MEFLFKIQRDKYLLNILTAKESFINYDIELKKQIREQVKIIKDSWYLRMILCNFFKGRENKQRFKKNDKNKIEIT